MLRETARVLGVLLLAERKVGILDRDALDQILGELEALVLAQLEQLGEVVGSHGVNANPTGPREQAPSGWTCNVEIEMSGAVKVEMSSFGVCSPTLGADPEIRREDVLRLSAKDRDRLVVLHQVQQKQLSVSAAARRLHLGVRQMRRVVRRFEEEGDASVVHALRERPSNRRPPSRWTWPSNRPGTPTRRRELRPPLGSSRTDSCVVHGLSYSNIL